MFDCDVIVVGGGISGLSMAWWLNREGANVILLEEAKSTGGKITTDSINGYTMENAASMVMNFRPEVCQFIQESGLDNLKIHRNALAENNRYLLHQQQLTTVPAKLSGVLTCSAWSWQSKLRMSLEPFIKKGGNENESVSEFITRRLGKELLESAIEPFVSGTLASDPDEANAFSCLPRLTALEQNHGGILKGIIHNKIKKIRSAMISDVFSFQGGMATLVKRLSDTLDFSEHAQLLKGNKVANIEKLNNGWRVTSKSDSGEREFLAPQLVVTTPAPSSSKLVSTFDSDLGALLAGIEYAALAVVHLGFDRNDIDHPLDGTGFLVPRREKLNINGNLWMSSLFPARAPKGKLLLTSYLGGARRPDAAMWEDEQTITTVTADINKALKVKAEPEFAHIKRHAKALPLYHGNYYNRCQQIKQYLSAQSGFHLEANYIGGISVRDRLANSKILAAQIIQELGIGVDFVKNETDTTCQAKGSII